MGLHQPPDFHAALLHQPPGLHGPLLHQPPDLHAALLHQAGGLAQAAGLHQPLQIDIGKCYLKLNYKYFISFDFA